MGKPTPSAPATPDPVATASAQGAANVQTAVANAYLNNPNQVTPYGTSTTTATGSPTFTPYQGSTIDQTPLSSDTYSSASLAEQAYQAQLQNSAANNSAFGSALGGIFGGIGKKSDVRLKSDVSPFARARNGLMIYRYKMAGEAPGWHFGFMAHEVALIHPEAVWTDRDDGFARVCYERAVA